jgi:pimeloyl-ACP methyl ester carboxylesterase
MRLPNRIGHLQAESIPDPHPPGTTRRIHQMPAVVLVHGSFHGSWCSSLVTEQLAGRGILSVAVDLDGHGLKNPSPASRWDRPFDPAAAEPSGMPAVTASSAAGSLVRPFRAIGGGEPRVIVAYSTGGAVATTAAEREARSSGSRAFSNSRPPQPQSVIDLITTAIESTS